VQILQATIASPPARPAKSCGLTPRLKPRQADTVGYKGHRVRAASPWPFRTQSGRGLCQRVPDIATGPGTHSPSRLGDGVWGSRPRRAGTVSYKGRRVAPASP
jgi:hypothetical protein